MKLSMKSKMSFWNRLRIVKIFFQLIRNPTRTDLIFKGVDIVSADAYQKPVEAVERRVMSNDEFRNMYETAYAPEAPRLEELRSLPSASFGYALYRHMSEHGLNFDLFPRLKTDRPIQYLRNRIYQDHDLWHVLLGEGVEVEDELAIQSFSVAQFQSPVGTVIVAGGLLHLLAKDPGRAVRAFQKINESYFKGRHAKFLLSIKLHELFPRPLAEVRQLCGLDHTNFEGTTGLDKRAEI